MQKEENKFVPSTVFEGMVSIRALLYAYEHNISDRKVIKILYSKDRISKIVKEVAFLRHEAERKKFYLEETTDAELAEITLGTSHGGLVAICSDRTIPPLDLDKIVPHGFYVMIEGIEDPYNFGYALRSLYAFGIDGVILPGRNWMTAAGVVSRASAGASERFPLFTATAEKTVEIFKKAGYSIVCADVDTDMSIENTQIPYPVLLIVGGEKRGISRNILNQSDRIVKINYGRDFSAALSAASATTVLAYEIAKQNNNFSSVDIGSDKK